MEFSRKEWSGLPFPFPGDLPDVGIEPQSPALQANSLQSAPPGKPNVPLRMVSSATALGGGAGGMLPRDRCRETVGTRSRAWAGWRSRSSRGQPGSGWPSQRWVCPEVELSLLPGALQLRAGRWTRGPGTGWGLCFACRALVLAFRRRRTFPWSLPPPTNGGVSERPDVRRGRSTWMLPLRKWFPSAPVSPFKFHNLAQFRSVVYL